MFFDKQQVIAMHEREFEMWQSLLAGLSSTQRSASLTDGLTIKDTLAHLAAWQSRTVARLEAALHGHAPRFPEWPVNLDDEESMEAVDQANAWILETHRSQSWDDVYQTWQNGYQRFLELARKMPEAEVQPGGKLAWMAEYQLLEGKTDLYDYHHAEHRDQLERWLSQQPDS